MLDHDIGPHRVGQPPPEGEPVLPAATVVVPEIHEHLPVDVPLDPPGPRLPLPVAPDPLHGAGSTASGTSLPSALALSISNVRAWSSSAPPWPVNVRMAHGRSYADADRHGMLVDGDGGDDGEVKVQAALRPMPVPLTDMATELPDGHRGAFLSAGRHLCADGNVPGHVAEVWEAALRRLQLGQPSEADWAAFAATGLADALQQDGIQLGRKQRRQCGKSTLEHRFVVDDRESRHISRLRCKSHRCKHCAPFLADWWRARVRAQLLRDADQGRPWPIFTTLTVDRADFHNAAAAYRLALRMLRRFFDRLRRRYGADLAYFVAVEAHTDGFPHFHLLIRSEALLAAMMLEAGATSVLTTLGEPDSGLGLDLLGLVERGGSRCIFPSLRKAIADMAVASGFGRSGFYIAPVRDLDAIASEVCKTRQIYPSMPRGTRRFRPSGHRGNGLASSSFFIDEDPAKVGRPMGPVPPKDADHAMQGARLDPVTVDPPSGAPLVTEAGDLPLRAGAYKVRVEQAALKGAAPRSRLLLRLRVQEPSAFRGATITHGLPLPDGSGSPAQRFQAELQGCLVGLGVVDGPVDASTLNGAAALGALRGREGWIEFYPPGAVPPDESRPMKYPRIRWYFGAAQPDVDAWARPDDPRTPVPLDWFEPDPAPVIPDGERITLDVAIHRAPIKAVVGWYRARGVKFCDPSFSPVVDPHGRLVRQLRRCVELPSEAEEPAEAVLDYLWWVAALERFPPPGFERLGYRPCMEAVAELYEALLEHPDLAAA